MSVHREVAEKMYSVRLPKEVAEAVDRIAKRSRRQRSDVLRIIIRDFVGHDNTRWWLREGQ